MFIPIFIFPTVVEKIKGFNGDIYVTLDTHKENYLETQEGKKLPVKHCIKGTNGHALNGEIKNALDKKENVYIYEKPTFGSVDLANTLKEKDFSEIEFVGLCTDICVISNALLVMAHLPEVKITVDASCCAGVTPESHNNALSAMKMCQINVIGD